MGMYYWVLNMLALGSGTAVGYYSMNYFYFPPKKEEKPEDEIKPIHIS
jgi:hypothetical protein